MTTESAELEFVRHRGPVTCVAGIPGSTTLVSSGYDGAVASFDLQTHQVALLGYHDHLVNKISVSGDGTLAASSSSDYSVALWDLQARRRRCVLLGHSDDVEDFAFVGDGRGVSVGRDWRILVWDLERGAILRCILGHQQDVLSVAVHEGRIYTSGDDMTLRAWDLECGVQVGQWGPFDYETDSCTVDTVRRRVVLGCDDGRLRIFDVDRGDAVAEIAAHAAGIKRVSACPRSGDLLTAAYDQRILIWDAAGAVKRELEQRPATWERSLNWTPDGRHVVGGTFDGTVLVWDAASGRCLTELGEPGRGNPCLNDVAASDGGYLAAVSDDGLVRLGRLSPCEACWLTTVEPRGGRVLANAVVFDEAGRRVITGAHDQILRLFRRHGAELREERAIRLDEGPINCLQVADQAGHEGDIFAACYSGAVVRLAPTGEVLARPSIHSGAVKALRLHPRLPLGVSCSADGSVLAWDLNGVVRRRFAGHMAIVDDVAIDPTGDRIASVSRDFTLKLYELATGLMLTSISLGRRSPKALCLPSPDIAIVSNYWGELLRIDLTSGRVLTRQIAENGISSVAARGGYLVAASYDGAAYLVDPEDLRVHAVLREMTQRIEPSPCFTRSQAAVAP